MNKNYEQLKAEYFEWIDKSDEIEKRLIENISKEIERNEYFIVFELPDSYDFYAEHDEEFKKYDKEQLKKDFEYYSMVKDEVVKERLEIFDKRTALNIEFDKWSNENDIGWKYIRDWKMEKEELVAEWRDWASDRIASEVMHKSIEKTDEDEIAKYIANARKALESFGYTHEYDYYETHDYLDYLEYINRDLRHGIDNNCMSLLAVDILENRGLWNVHREGFDFCVMKIMEDVDSTFLHWNGPEDM